MSASGSDNSGFNSTIRGSFHLVIMPKYMSAKIEPVNFNPLSGTPGRLYAATTEPMVSGICTAQGAFVCSSGVSGASVAPKSTVFSVNC